jgi:hypothetical protein
MLNISQPFPIVELNVEYQPRSDAKSRINLYGVFLFIWKGKQSEILFHSGSFFKIYYDYGTIAQNLFWVLCEILQIILNMSTWFYFLNLNNKFFCLLQLNLLSFLFLKWKLFHLIHLTYKVIICLNLLNFIYCQCHVWEIHLQNLTSTLLILIIFNLVFSFKLII